MLVMIGRDNLIHIPSICDCVHTRSIGYFHPLVQGTLLCVYALLSVVSGCNLELVLIASVSCKCSTGVIRTILGHIFMPCVISMSCLQQLRRSATELKKHMRF